MKKRKNPKNIENKATGTGSQILPVRLPLELLALLDREVAQRREKAPWKEVNRSELVREAIYRCFGPKREAAPPLLDPRSTTTIIETKTEPKTKAEPTPLPKDTSPVKGAIDTCRICGRSLPEGRTALCGREECFREDKNARERERKKTLRKGNQ